MSLFSLDRQLIFYGSYHNNKVNQIIHFIFVPIILWTVCVWLAYTPAFYSFDCPFMPSQPEEKKVNPLVCNGATLLIGVYSLYYIILDRIAGITWMLFIGMPIWLGSELFQGYFPETAWMWALGIHIMSWFMQIVPGHMIAEKRKPALMDSFVQSLLLAPLFVWFELLFLLGYRKDLYHHLQTEIQSELRGIAAATKKTIVTSNEEKEPLLSSPPDQHDDIQR